MNQIQCDCLSLPQIERSSGRLCSSMNFGVHQLVLLWAGSPSDAPGQLGEGLGVSRLGHPRQLLFQLGHQVLPKSKSDGASAAQLPLPGGVYRGQDGCREGLGCAAAGPELAEEAESRGLVRGNWDEY